MHTCTPDTHISQCPYTHTHTHTNAPAPRRNQWPDTADLQPLSLSSWHSGTHMSLSSWLDGTHHTARWREEQREKSAPAGKGMRHWSSVQLQSMQRQAMSSAPQLCLLPILLCCRSHPQCSSPAVPPECPCELRLPQPSHPSCCCLCAGSHS